MQGLLCEEEKLAVRLEVDIPGKLLEYCHDALAGFKLDRHTEKVIIGLAVWCLEISYKYKIAFELDGVRVDEWLEGLRLNKPINAPVQTVITAVAKYLNKNIAMLSDSKQSSRGCDE